MKERPEFGRIEFAGKRKLKITSGGVTSTIEEKAAPTKTLDRGKDRKINPDLLSNLRSLTTYAQGPSGDTSDQNYDNEEIEKLKEKFPDEQAAEVWRRTLATLMADGNSIQSIATALLEGSYQYKLSTRLEGVPPATEGDELNKLRRAVKEFWPKRK